MYRKEYECWCNDWTKFTLCIGTKPWGHVGHVEVYSRIACRWITAFTFQVTLPSPFGWVAGQCGDKVKSLLWGHCTCWLCCLTRHLPTRLRSPSGLLHATHGPHVSHSVTTENCSPSSMSWRYLLRGISDELWYERQVVRFPTMWSTVPSTTAITITVQSVCTRSETRGYSKRSGGCQDSLSFHNTHSTE
jgi:hypothetical protein